MKRPSPPAASPGDTGLAGSMIPRTARRTVDQRWEPRHSGLVDDAVLGARGREKLVRVVNISREGAMLTPAPALRIGEAVTLRLAGDVVVEGSVRWIRENRMGINFAVTLTIES